MACTDGAARKLECKYIKFKKSRQVLSEPVPGGPGQRPTVSMSLPERTPGALTPISRKLTAA
ncbi:hypothetical protein BOO71_0001783 [Deinococcus marmoris]|uniref:Uncharacterized protein n=1 Tax=Deinococcus marmoris TaxID=249408 RepID=A0A1U7P3S2_9DEIO|nr:hypothetical protein BOO71_0001783 [Deinococcus marmoris]